MSRMTRSNTQRPGARASEPAAGRPRAAGGFSRCVWQAGRRWRCECERKMRNACCWRSAADSEVRAPVALVSSAATHAQPHSSASTRLRNPAQGLRSTMSRMSHCRAKRPGARNLFRSTPPASLAPHFPSAFPFCIRIAASAMSPAAHSLRSANAAPTPSRSLRKARMETLSAVLFKNQRHVRICRKGSKVQRWQRLNPAFAPLRQTERPQNHSAGNPLGGELL